jgi:hypothetical protein
VTKQSVVEINSKTTAMTEFSIRNVNGAVLATKKIQVNQGVNKIHLTDFQIDKLAVGMYFMAITNDAFVTQKRFLVSE